MTPSSFPPGSAETSAMPQFDPSVVVPMVIVEPYPSIRMAVADRVNLHLPGLKVAQFSNGQDTADVLRDPNTNVHTLVTALEMEGGHGIKVVKHAFESDVQHVVLMTDRDLNYLRRVFGAEVMGELLDKGLKLITKPHLRQFDQKVIDPLRAKFAPRSS